MKRVILGLLFFKFWPYIHSYVRGELLRNFTEIYKYRQILKFSYLRKKRIFSVFLRNATNIVLMGLMTIHLNIVINRRKAQKSKD